MTAPPYSLVSTVSRPNGRNATGNGLKDWIPKGIMMILARESISKSQMPERIQPDDVEDGAHAVGSSRLRSCRVGENLPVSEIARHLGSCWTSRPVGWIDQRTTLLMTIALELAILHPLWDELGDPA